MSNIKRIIINFLIKRYYEILKSIKDSDTTNPLLVHGDLVLENQEHDAHIFDCARDIQIEFQYSIAVINKICENEKVCMIPLAKVLTMLARDIENNKENFAEISSYVKTKWKHKYDRLIIIEHMPSGTYMLADGRHRLVEYVKFSSKSSNIPVLLVSSELVSRALLNRNAFVAYQIQHNLYALNELPLLKALKYYNPIGKILRLEYMPSR